MFTHDPYQNYTNWGAYSTGATPFGLPYSPYAGQNPGVNPGAALSPGTGIPGYGGIHPQQLHAAQILAAQAAIQQQIQQLQQLQQLQQSQSAAGSGAAEPHVVRRIAESVCRWCDAKPAVESDSGAGRCSGIADAFTVPADRSVRRAATANLGRPRRVGCWPAIRQPAVRWHPPPVRTIRRAGRWVLEPNRRRKNCR